MTKTQFTKRLKEMTRNTKHLTEEECMRLFKSGAINTGDYEDNYLLPKIILTAALENIARRFHPLNPKDKRRETVSRAFSDLMALRGS